MKCSLLVLVFFSCSVALTQTLQVLDQSDLQPIESVAIINLQNTANSLTNKNGLAEMAMFSNTDTLFFQHPSYQEYFVSFSSLAEMNYQVTLTRSTVNLSEFVVSASKWEQKREEVPNRITRLQSKDMAYLNPQTTADLLGDSREVFIQKSQLGGGSPMIRGFSANSVLIVVDGVRMNNAIFRSGNLHNIILIDANIVEEAEIIYGPGSIIYGSDALGGVMDFHTKGVEYPEEEKSKFSGQALMRFSTANMENTAHIDLNYARERWGSFTSLSFSDFQDLRMGSRGNEEYQRLHYVEQSGGKDMMISNTDPNIQKFSGYNQLNITQKFSYKISNYSKVDYGFRFSNSSNVPRYDRLIQYEDNDTLKYAEWYYGPQLWMMHTLGIDLGKTNAIYDDARFTLAYQHVEESRHDRKFNDEFLRSRTENVDVFSLNMDLDNQLSMKSSLFYGLEGVYNYVASSASEMNIHSGQIGPASTRYPDGGSDYATFAAYINLKSNLHKRLTVQAGLRYSYIYALSVFQDTSFYPFPFSDIRLNTSALNASLGLVFRTSDQSRLNLNVSSGFRAPNIDDMAKVFDSEPGNVVVPNENLDPEYAYNVDLGLVRNFGSGIHMELTGFYTYITNLMVRRNTQVDGQDSIYYDGELSQVQTLENASNGWVAGFSFNFGADISKRLGFRTSLNYIRGADADGEPIRHVSPLFGSAGFTYSAKKVKVELWVDYNGSIVYDHLAPTERNKPHLYARDTNGNPYSPSWYTINIKSFYQINPFLQANIGIENLLDQRYRTYSSGIVSPGLNFVMALRASF